MSKASKADKAKLNRGWSHIPVAQRRRYAKEQIMLRQWRLAMWQLTDDLFKRLLAQQIQVR